ncbi:MAG: hypothetical protein RMK18_11785 [Armatimonadota bacterium]|nr:hypothetical protein [Armatimonadota bacterium]MDW8026527.1 hypothetical protein [Armatimonadota bacterium]
MKWRCYLKWGLFGGLIAITICGIVVALSRTGICGEITGIEVKPAPVGQMLIVTSVIGRGEIRERTAATWQLLRARMTVMPDYQVRTEKESAVEARWEPTQTRVKISHDTLIEMRSDRIAVLAGRIWVCAAQKPGERIPLVIQTPNAYVATERGWVSVAQLPWGWSLVSCDRGNVSVAARNSVVILRGGEMTFVAPGMRPDTPMKITCGAIDWNTRIYLEEFVKRCQDMPPRPLSREFLSCAERLLWDAGGVVPK